jgi:glutamyl/glutaminyl-tRNA synthetase
MDDATATATLTRFAPAPTGYLHLGHVANAVWTWGLAASRGARVLLRIEDHDRQRRRPEFDEALLEDLDWLGFRAALGPVRQSDPDAGTAYRAALDVLQADGLVYGCDCSRSTFSAWVAANGRAWSGAGCPGGCRARGVSGPVLRVDLGGGSESWTDALAGPCQDDVAPAGDLPIRDRHGNWTYGFCVVVDDVRQGVDLVVRGRDLLHATASQVRLGRTLGRPTPPTFAHHPLVLRPDGRKLSKSAGDTGVRELRAAGRAPAEVIEMAAVATGYRPESGV